MTSNNILFGEPVVSLPGAGGGALKAGSGYPESAANKAFSEGFLFQEIITYRTVVQFSPGINEGEATMHNLVGLKPVGSHLAWQASPSRG